ncbi:MAG: hypothetical protein DMG13_06075 [Acidobacteria bacterium]|nr:MAG: hypothetical protein DMG13_06075 [Acidobacteriota bacterium]
MSGRALFVCLGIFVCLWILARNDSLQARSAGPPPNVNGLSGNYCTQCHRTNPLNSGNGSVRLEGLPSMWVPGDVYSLRVVVTHETARRWGFQLSSTGSNGEQAGDLLPGPDGRTAVQTATVNGSQVQFIQHTSLGSTIDGPNTFEFSYRAPISASAGVIRFHLAGNATDGSGTNTGDFVYGTQINLPIAISDSRNFAIADRGGMSLTSVNRGNAVSAGHARAQADSGPAPAGMEIVSLRQNDVMVSEAAFAASAPLRSGRVYTEISGSVNTGVAIANPNASPATVSFYFTDDSGSIFDGGSTVLAPNAQIAGFLDQPPFYMPGPFRTTPVSNSRTFTFTSSVPVSVLALRGTTNSRSEFVIAPLQIVDLSTSSNESISIPVLADGGGWTTQLLLVNPTDDTLTGSVQFLAAAGEPLTLSVSGQTGPQSAYSVPPRSSRRLQTAGTGDTTQTGSMRIVPATGSRAPAAVALFSLRVGGVTTMEWTLTGTRSGTAFRVYAEASGDFTAGRAGSFQSGVAIANHGSAAATVNLDLNTLDGVSSGWTGSVNIPAQGQIGVFLNQIQASGPLPASFQGVLRVSTAAASGVSVAGFRGRFNERSTSNLLLSGMPAVNENTPSSSTEVVFPHVVDSGGYSTQFILFSGAAGQSSTGVLRFYSQSGQAMPLILR